MWCRIKVSIGLISAFIFMKGINKVMFIVYRLYRRDFILGKIKKNTRLFLAVIVLVCLASVIYAAYRSNGSVQEVEYNEFKELVKDGKVDTVYYSGSDDYMTFSLYNETTKGMSRKELESYKYENKDLRKTQYPSYDTFRKDLLESGVHLSYQDDSVFLSIISTLLPIVAMVLALRWIMNKQLNPIGSSKKDTSLLVKSDVRFSDVIGHDEILEDIKFISRLIKDPKLGDEVGAKLPKGILLSGPTGTGKTLIVKAIAGESGVPFVSMNGSDFKEMFVGMGAKRVRELFEVARQNSPCIVFIDEIDAVGTSRSNVAYSSPEDTQTINALLKEMDGFSERSGIFVIAATNYSNVLDKALTRPGRFDREIVINKPKDWTVRAKLFKHYLDKYSVSDDVNIDAFAKQCSGFTGADIMTICNEASIIAVMKGISFITSECIEEAIDKRIFKGNRSKNKHKEDINIVAYHESGHAVMSYLLGVPISRASIIGTTSGVGGAVFQEDSESSFMTEEEIRKRVMICYAGRASEEIKFSESRSTTGASNDITQATSLIISYIGNYGFDSSYGLVDMRVLINSQIYSSREVQSRVSLLSVDLYRSTVDLLTDNYKLVELLATKLLESETLSGDEISKLFDAE